MKIFKEIDNGNDLRNWAISESWCIDDIINTIDELDGWQDVYDYINNYEQDLSETELNDVLRFEIDEFLQELATAAEKEMEN